MIGGMLLYELSMKSSRKFAWNRLLDIIGTVFLSSPCLA